MLQSESADNTCGQKKIKNFRTRFFRGVLVRQFGTKLTYLIRGSKSSFLKIHVDRKKLKISVQDFWGCFGTSIWDKMTHLTRGLWARLAPSRLELLRMNFLSYTKNSSLGHLTSLFTLKNASIWVKCISIVWQML